MKTKGIIMTPELAAQLSDFCEPDNLDVTADTLEDILDYIIAEKTDDPKTTLAWVSIVRNLSRDLQALRRAVVKPTEERESHGLQTR